MSGLEPLAALGLVCNILQLVELGQKTINCIKTVYQEGKLDQDLEENAVVLEKLTNEIKKDSRPGNKKYEAILLQSAASCSTAARDLQEELRFLFGNAKRGSFASAVKVTATVKWRQRRLERLGRNLDTEEKRLQTGLLAQVWSSTNAAHIDTRGVRRELRFFIEQYRQGRRETMDLVSSEGLKTREIILRETQRTNGAIALVDQKLDRLVLREGAQTDDQVREDFLKSLKYPEFNQRRSQVDNAFEDTLKWVFAGDDEDESDEDHKSQSVSDTDSDLGSESEWSDESYPEASHSEEEDEDQELLSNIKWDSFSNWLRSTDAIYWISGKPGSGKTTLVKYILGQPQTRKYLDVWSPGCEIASHYFWRPGSPMQKNLEGLFCSLLYQILVNNDIALKEVMSSISGPKDSFTDWSSNELRLALFKALGSCKNGVCLFLDGLDEIDPGNGTKDGIPELLDLVFELSQMGNTKFCLASRPNPYILEMRLSMHPQLRLQDLNYADLMAYAKEHVKYPQTESSEEYDNMIDLLVGTAQGVFLWLILGIKSINEGTSYHDSAETLTERINRLPKGLDSLYQDMWARVGADSPLEYRKTAALYFKLLISSGRPGSSSAGKSSTLRGIGIFGHGFNVFDLMLATTPIADGILDALDDPSKLIAEDLMQQRCREVERKLKIYCMGLVEERPGHDIFRERASDWSWYGHMYDSVWPSAIGPRLEFIHRTASDFLTDTEAGSKILDIDTSSGFTLHCQLLKAWLAKHAIFASKESAYAWADLLRAIRETWKGAKEWISKDWDRIVLICEKLANSGRLFDGIPSLAEPCGGSCFLKVLADRNSDDEIIIARLKSTNLRDEDKSAILLSLSDSTRFSLSGYGVQSRLRTFRELLRAGADPNWHTWERMFGDSFATLQTPWLKYLLTLMVDLTKTGFLRDFTTEAPEMAGIASVFISEGANLDDTVDMYLNRDETERNWVLRGIQQIYHKVENGVYASIPAYMIINILTETVRLCSMSIKGSCQDSCASLERACLNHRSSIPCRVFGKRKWQNEKFVMCETTSGMQTELGNILIETLRRQLSLTAPSLERDIGSETNESRFAEMTDSIINDESWIETTRGKNAPRDWLKDRGLAMFVDERPGIEKWVEMHRNGLLKSGLIM